MSSEAPLKHGMFQILFTSTFANPAYSTSCLLPPRRNVLSWRKLLCNSAVSENYADIHRHIICMEYIYACVYIFPYGYQKRDRLGIRQREKKKFWLDRVPILSLEHHGKSLWGSVILFNDLGAFLYLPVLQISTRMMPWSVYRVS